MNEITEAHREAARTAITIGFSTCVRIQNARRPGDKVCDCGGKIDGCKAEVEAIAQAIANGGQR